jgi:hypothetical protein
LSTATVTGKVANPNGITGLSISEIKFFSTDSMVHTVPDQATVVLKLAALNAQVPLSLIPAKLLPATSVNTPEAISESDGTTFATLGIQHANITIGGTDNKTLTINPSANLESGKSYYRQYPPFLWQWFH